MKATELFREIERAPEARKALEQIESQVSLARNIIRLRQSAGLSQAELAARVGMRQPRIAELESGSANPRLKTLQRVAGALGVDMGKLFEVEPRAALIFDVVYSKPVATEVIVSPAAYYADAELDAALVRGPRTALRRMQAAAAATAVSA